MQPTDKSCNPFVISFTPDAFNCDFFRIREQQTEYCVNILKDSRLLMLTGNSGAGKSYLVRCGIMPSLKQHIHQEGKEYIPIIFSPGISPITLLAQKLSKEGILHNEQDADDIYSLTAEENLRNDDNGLLNILQQADIQNKKFVFFVDHLEELLKNPAFRNNPDFLEEIRLFFCLFLKLVASSENPAYVIFALRSKFLSFSRFLPELSQVINHGFYSVSPFSKRELRLIVDYRLSKCSLVLSGTFRERLYQDISEYQLPYRLINHALYRSVEFWKAGSIKENVIDEDFYIHAGGITEALNNHAEEVFEKVKEEGLDIAAERLFRLLVNAQNLQFPLLRVLTVRRLSELSGFSVNKVIRTLEFFRQANCPVLKHSTSSALEADTAIQITDLYIIDYWKRLRQWYNNEHVSVTILMWLVKSANAYFNNEGSLYQEPMLTKALEWRDKERPSKSWARNYSQDFDKAMEFLTLSEQARQQERQDMKKTADKKSRKFYYLIMGGMLVLTLIFAVYGLISSQRAAEESKEARKNSRLSQANNLVVLSRDLMGKDPTLALRLAQKASTYSDAKYIRNITRRIYSENNFYRIISKLPHEIRSLELAPNEKFLIAASGNNAFLMDLNGRKLNILSAHKRMVNCVDVSSDSKYVITGALDNTCRIWNLNGETMRIMKRHTGTIEACRFSPKDKYIATVGRDNKVILWNGDGKYLRTIDQGKANVYDVHFSPDGKKLLTAWGDYYARLYDLSGNLIRKYKHAWDKVFSVQFAHSGNQILTANRYGFHLWNINGRKLQEFKGHANYINNVYFSPDDRYVLSASSDKTIKLWNKEGIQLQEFLGHEHRIMASDMFKNGQKFLSGSKDNTIRLWKIDYNKLFVYTGHSEEVSSIVSSPEGLSFLSASWDNTARLFHPLTGTKTVFSGHEDDLSRVAFLKNGHRILTASDDGTVILWKRNGEQIRQFEVHNNVVAGLDVAPDEKYFITSSWDNTAKLWNFDGELLQTFKGHLGSVYDVAFSPSGKYICTGSRDQTARVWDKDGNLHNILRGHTARINDVEFSPDGRYILTASWDNTAILWDVSGHIVHRFDGHDNYVNAADFSHDGKYIVTASFDNTAKLWDLKGNELQSFKGHNDFVRDASFSIEDKFVLTASSDKTTRIWKIKVPLKKFLENADFEELNNFQRFKYDVIDMETLIKKGNEKELLNAAAFCVENSHSFHDNRQKIKWLKRAARLYEKAYTFYHRTTVKQKIARVYALQIKVYLYLEQFTKALEAFHTGIEVSPNKKLLRRYEPLVYLLNASRDIAVNVYRERMYEPYDEMLLYKELFLADIKSMRNRNIQHEDFKEVIDLLKN